MSDLFKDISDLTPEKRELLELLLQDEGIEVDSTLVIPQERVWNDDLNGYQMPLSFAQQRLWFLDQFSPNSPLYNLPSAIQLTGALDLNVFARSIELIIKRHESLRTNFTEVDGEPFQIIKPDLEYLPQLIDLSELSEDEREAELLRLIEVEARIPFNLETDTLFRVKLIRLKEQDHVVLLTVHHIISDGWSMGLLIAEIVQIYESIINDNEFPLQELAIQYADFAVWQKKWLHGDVLEEQIDYWRQQLGDSHPILGLPTDHPRAAVRVGKGESYFFELPTSVSKRIRDFAQQEGTTLFVTLLTAFAALLFRYTNQDDVRLGTPIAGRSRREIEGLIGFFVNTLVMKADLIDDPTFRVLLAQVREFALGAYSHQDLPFEMLVEALQPERDMSHPPLFQVMFSLQNAPAETWELPGLTVHNLPVHSGTAKFDLSLILYEKALEGEEYVLGGTMEYDSDLFEAATIERMMGHFQVLIESIITEPDTPIQEIKLLTDDERHQLLVEWNTTLEEKVHPGKCIQELFEEQVVRTPDLQAVVYEKNALTYEELNQRANQLAFCLRNLDVTPDDLVGLCVERSLDLIIGILGIIKSGAAYLPLDPRYPPDRLAYMLNDAQAPVMLTQKNVLAELKTRGMSQQFDGEGGPVVICLDSDWDDQIGGQNQDNLSVKTTPDNLAYAIYTSGSTGAPKGVLIEHRSAINLMEGLKRTIYDNPSFELKPYDDRSNLRLSLNAPISFDASVQQWIMLLSGHTLYIIPDEVRLDGDALLQFIRHNELDILDCVPSQLKLLIEVGLLDEPGWLPQAILPGGEAIDTETWETLHRSGEVKFYNMYGPTECAVDSTICFINRHSSPPSIGRPNLNVRHYILDRKLRPVPIGIPGELYIGGEGVGRGYLDRPELTAERFLPNPFANLYTLADKDIERVYPPVDRIYKTGDLVRYLPSGNIEFLGRADFQVKVRGFRIELGEIESVLKQHPSLKTAVIMAREDTPSVQQLVAYLIPAHVDDDGDRVRVMDVKQYKDLISELRDFLKDRLPDYMLPSAYVVLSALPLTPNAKINRNALPAPDREHMQDERAFVAPSSADEHILAGIWEQVLGISDIGVSDNFFELGGHSLLATRVLSRSRRAFNIDIPLRFIFDAPTISEFAKRVEQLRREETGLALPPIQPTQRDDDLPLSFGQQRLWFLDQLEPESPVYNIPDAIKVDGHLDLAVLENSLNEIVRRHEILRTSFSTVEGKPIQIIAPELHVAIPLIDLSQLPDDDRESELERLVVEEGRRGFNLANSPLFRVSLLKLGDQEWVILFTLHHIISDGWSTGVLIREVASLYPSFNAGFTPDEAQRLLPELEIQYLDYARWQRQWLAGEVLDTQIEYWKSQLAGVPPMLDLPLDRPRPAMQSSRGEQEHFELPGELSKGLRAMSQRQGVTLFMLMLAAFQALLYRYSGQEIIAVGTPIANRNRAEIERLIGFFVNTLVMRADLSDEPNFQELLQQVREMALGAYAHQELPFEMLVDAIQPERDLRHSPLFQVMFMLQNAAQEKIELPDLQLSRLPVSTGISMFDITLVINEAGDELFGGVEYNADLFDRNTIQRLFNHYILILEAIVSDPTQKVSQVPLLSEGERQQVLATWNDTYVDYDLEVALHQLFETQVEKTPESLAVIGAGESLSYNELNRRANQLGHYLRNHGVGRGTLVGISINRSVEMLVGLLGTMKAGCAYVPLDPSYPPERLEFIIRDAQVEVILTCEDAREKLTEYGAKLVSLDTDWGKISQGPETNLDNSTFSKRNLVYVIYTSGSTGTPKGVMVEHNSVVNFCQYCIEAYQLSAKDRVLQFATINFDTAVEEIFPTLLSGATLVLRNDEVLMSGEELATMITEYGLTVLDLPTAYWHEWVYELLLTGKRLPDGVRLVIVGGEKCLKERYENWLQVGGASSDWVNTYGPTEATVIASLYRPKAHEMERWSEVPIGRPIANGKLYVLDSNLMPVPVGVSGELCIGGVGVARGYLNAQDKTAERFIPDAFSGIPGARLYRTGDLVRFLPDGNIEFIGRVDYQVKVRGFRVELTEIDSVLSQNPEVREAVTVAISSGSDHLRLVSYVVPSRVEKLGEAERYKKNLREFVKGFLPEYMVPSAIVLLEELPISPSGKLDRRALPEPEQEHVVLETEYVAPRTEEEEILASIWTDVLGVDRISIFDNFFELGGDSILSIQIIARSGMEGLRLTPKNLFENPTIAGMANVAERGVVINAEQGIVEGNVVITPIQHWFFEQDLKNRDHYNQALLLEVNQPLQVEDLQIAVDQMLSHHDALRLRYQDVEDHWQQWNVGLESAMEGVDHFVHVEMSDTPDAELSRRIRDLANEFQADLDITDGPIFRVILFDPGKERPARLLLVAHHLAIDGVSWRILLEDLETVYYQVSTGKDIQLPLKTSSYMQWATRLSEYAQTEAARSELAYWKEISTKDAGRVPVDKVGGVNIEQSQRSVSVSLNEDDTQALLFDVPSAYQTEINDALLTALTQVLRRWTETNLVLIEMEGHGREHLFEDLDVSRTMGWFTSIYPVLLELSGRETTGEALKSVKEQLRSIPNHGIGYGLLRYLIDDEEIRQTMSSIPGLQVSFNYLGQFDQAIPDDGIFGIARESRGRDRDASGNRGTLLDINGGILRGRLTLEWSFSKQIHQHETIEKLANEYMEALRNIIRHCQAPEAEGFTPSDFPMAGLAQKDLDNLLGKIKK